MRVGDGENRERLFLKRWRLYPVGLRYQAAFVALYVFLSSGGAHLRLEVTYKPRFGGTARFLQIQFIWNICARWISCNFVILEPLSLQRYCKWFHNCKGGISNKRPHRPLRGAHGIPALIRRLRLPKRTPEFTTARTSSPFRDGLDSMKNGK
jgi:hypothetical protein